MATPQKSHHRRPSRGHGSGGAAGGACRSARALAGARRVVAAAAAGPCLRCEVVAHAFVQENLASTVLSCFHLAIAILNSLYDRNDHEAKSPLTSSTQRTHTEGALLETTGGPEAALRRTARAQVQQSVTQGSATRRLEAAEAAIAELRAERDEARDHFWLLPRIVAVRSLSLAIALRLNFFGSALYVLLLGLGPRFQYMSLHFDWNKGSVYVIALMLLPPGGLRARSRLAPRSATATATGTGATRRPPPAFATLLLILLLLLVLLLLVVVVALAAAHLAVLCLAPAPAHAL